MHLVKVGTAADEGSFGETGFGALFSVDHIAQFLVYESVEDGILHSFKGPQTFITAHMIKLLFRDAFQADLLKKISTFGRLQVISVSASAFGKCWTPKRSIVEAECIAALLLFAEVDAVSRKGDIVLLKEHSNGQYRTRGKVRSGQTFVSFDAAEAVVAGD